MAVNNTTVTELGSRVEPGTDLVSVDGKLVTPPDESSYFLLYKPVGVVTTLSDPQGRPTVANYVEETGKRLFPVGRLDYDAEGALLFTDDGALAHKLTHPSFQVPRTYLAKVKGQPDVPTLEKLRGGVRLEDGMATPVSVGVFEAAEKNTWLKIVVAEGRPHLIKRLCAAVGHPVVRLFRPAYAGVGVEGLRPGELRPLKKTEVELLNEVADGKTSPPSSDLRLPPRRHGRAAPGFDEADEDELAMDDDAAPVRRKPAARAERKPAGEGGSGLARFGRDRAGAGRPARKEFGSGDAPRSRGPRAEGGPSRFARPARKEWGEGARGEGRPARKSFGSDEGRPARKSFGSDEGRPARKTFGGDEGRPARKSFGSDEGRPARKTFGSDEGRPARKSFGAGGADRPARKSFGAGGEARPARKSFGAGGADRPARKSFGAGGEDRPARRSFGAGSEDRPARKSFGTDRPARKSFGAGSEDRPARRSFGAGSEDRPARKSFGTDRPARKPFGAGSEDRPARKSFGAGGSDRPARKPFGAGGEDRPARKSFGAGGEDRPRGPRGAGGTGQARFGRGGSSASGEGRPRFGGARSEGGPARRSFGDKGPPRGRGSFGAKPGGRAPKGAGGEGKSWAPYDDRGAPRERVVRAGARGAAPTGGGKSEGFQDWGKKKESGSKPRWSAQAPRGGRSGGPSKGPRRPR
ncbi:ribosomal large subunit pseudouridine synthase B [Myxococcus fulvus 124B02]|nr:ribosomal large subunit pseudouridine synthase B [Myxococcus fulvus 124B02]